MKWYYNIWVFFVGIILLIAGFSYTIEVDMNYEKLYKCAGENLPKPYFKLEVDAFRPGLCQGFDEYTIKNTLASVFFFAAISCFAAYFMTYYKKSIHQSRKCH